MPASTRSAARCARPTWPAMRPSARAATASRCWRRHRCKAVLSFEGLAEAPQPLGIDQCQRPIGDTDCADVLQFAQGTVDDLSRHARQAGQFLLRHAQVAVLGARIEPGIRQLDRKSTRLNSSHLVISYAVFCLKKK